MTMMGERLAAGAGALAPALALAPGESDERREVPGLAGSFHLHYQPELRLADRSVAGCEALLRWDHPISGVMSPGQMLADCDALPGVAALGVWTIYAAARQAARWRAEDCAVPVTINLAAHQVRDPELLDRLHRAVVCTGLPAGALAVDLPAAMLELDPEGLLRAARAIVELGASVALEGLTPDADPAALARVPASALKVARRPDGDPAGYAADLARVLPLARAMGAEVVAVRVESVDEVAALARAGCDRAFGHAVAPPAPPGEIAALLRA
jgi:EAL domain-containing protein (putative c-di-GMP-specific phosphodiesterase class I)